MPKAASSQKPPPDKNQTSLLGFFGRPGQPPPPRPTPSSSAAATTSTSSQGVKKANGFTPPAFVKKNQTPPIASSESTSLGTPALSTTSSKAPASSSPVLPTPSRSNGSAKPMQEDDEESEVVEKGWKDAMDVDAEDDEDEEPVRLSSRSSKKRPTYVISDESESEAERPARPKAPAQKKRKVSKNDDDDDFDMDFEDMNDEDMVMALDEAERASSNRPSASAFSGSESDTPASNSKAQFKKKATAKPSRPPAKPLGSAAKGGSSSRGGKENGSGGIFMTQSERNKIEEKEKKKEEETCFEFLVDRKDADGNLPGDPDFDNRTIHIPRKCWAQFTPFEKQFWEIKQDHFDVVLFFQKGKFYELYENDAEIGHNEFDLKLTDRVKMKMVGVPESSFDFWAAKFLAAGYKVGKVEQAETAIGMEMRLKESGAKGGKEIVRRELASVYTNGTVVDPAFLAGDEACHCVAIKEYSEAPNLPSSFGVCFMEASTGCFELAAFEDDMCNTRLETMFRQIKPKEILHEKGNLSVGTTRLLKRIVPMTTTWVSLRPKTEFCDAATTLENLTEFFSSEEESEGGDIPESIVTMKDEPLAMEALGGMIFYLKSLNMDKDLLSQKNFNIYDPIRKGNAMVLDGQSLSHLEILLNNEGTIEGTLLELLQRCITPFGKRLFHIWLSVPLLEISAINDRLDAVQDLMDHPNFAETFTRTAKTIPDLERIISRIHAGKCKQKDFLACLDALRRIQSGIQKMLKDSENFESKSLGAQLRNAPDMAANLKHVSDMFVLSDGIITPAAGASEACDEAVEAVDNFEGQLDELLETYKEKLRCDKLVFWHSAQGLKEVYHINTPVNIKVPGSWTKVGGTKGSNRYVTPDSLPLIREVQEARETRKIAFQGFYGELLAEFDKDRDVWLKAVQVFAEVDCLMSLTKASASLDEPRCRPEFVESEHAFIDFKDLRHPSMCLRSDFISNDVQLGGAVARQALLTGPNTAGKSTLCRMTAVAVILAQIGCWVPASSATLSPVDKIQTRMGAYDNMFSSSSTFKVELDECSKILKEAGPKSLIILDELGRGTSTYDGMAIAEAVLHHIATHTLPLGFFATHYGALTDDFDYHPNIRCMYMQTQVDAAKREVVCLYKLIPGRAESSYGTHVAHLAGVPFSVVDRAEEVSKEFFSDFQAKIDTKRGSSLSTLRQADFNFLISLAQGKAKLGGPGDLMAEMDIIRKAISL